MSGWKSLCSAAVFALVPVGPAMAETLQDALDAAYQSNPDLASQRTSAEIAREALESARAAGRPSVSLTASAGYESLDSTRAVAFDTGDRPIANASLQATQPLFTSGRISGGIRQAAAGVSAADLQLEAQRQTLFLDTVSAYVNVRRDLEAVAIRENNVEVLVEQARAAADRFEVGVVTRTDVKLAEARLAGTRAALAGAEATLEGSRANYVQVVGVAPVALDVPPPPPPLPTTIEDAITIALGENPDLLAARENVRAAEAAIRVAEGSRGPEISLVGTASAQQTYTENEISLGGGPPVTDDNPSDTTVSAVIQARIPLYQGGQLNADVRSASLRRRQAREAVDGIERQVRAGVAQSWYGYIAATQSIAASEAQVEAAEIAYEGAKEELAVGVRTTLDVLDQEQELFDARLALIDAERDAYVSAHQLLRQMGRLTLDRSGAS
ncbi:MAG: TolC family outer membrane protein [Pseudomonadota bacterium]